jgi:hypothetical protein
VVVADRWSLFVITCLSKGRPTTFTWAMSQSELCSIVKKRSTIQVKPFSLFFQALQQRVKIWDVSELENRNGKILNSLHLNEKIRVRVEVRDRARSKGWKCFGNQM